MSRTQQEVPEAMSAEGALERIERHVRLKTHGQVRHLTVTVRSRVVCLEGECRTYYTKQLASQAALEACAELDACAGFELRNAIDVS